jgi:hypothetical protein
MGFNRSPVQGVPLKIRINASAQFGGMLATILAAAS